MAIDATLPTASIGDLAQTVLREANDLEASLNKLRSACQRDPGFTGSAATKYDEYIARWDQHQAGLVSALRDAGALLQQFTDKLHALDQTTAGVFTV